MNILKYKGYEGTAELDMDRQECRGKILFIDDLVTYKASNPAELRAAFESAVDDYLSTCEQLRRQPKVPLSGTFNVRVTPQLHKEMKLRAICDGVSLNEAVARAFDCYVHGYNVVNNTIFSVASSTETVRASVGQESGVKHVYVN